MTDQPTHADRRSNEALPHTPTPAQRTVTTHNCTTALSHNSTSVSHPFHYFTVVNYTESGVLNCTLDIGPKPSNHRVVPPGRMDVVLPRCSRCVNEPQLRLCGRWVGGVNGWMDGWMVTAHDDEINE